MKVAMVDPSLFTMPYDVALCSALMAKGCDVTLYGRVLRPLENTPDEAALRTFFYGWSERIKTRTPSGVFHLMKGLEHALDMTRFARNLRQERPAVVHFQWVPVPAIDMSVLGHIRRSIGPAVLTVHDMTPFNNAPSSALQRLGSTSIWRAFDQLIVHSDESKLIMARSGLDLNRISVIPHGVLDTVSAVARAERQDHRLVILMFGRVKRYKGVDLMIEALASLPAELRAQCQLLVVGEPMIPMEPLEKLAIELGVADNITWDLRYVSDAGMSEVFSQADIFAFPYREIDTSGVLMACLPYGRPIIATGIGAFQKLLQDRVHGRVIPPHDSGALAAAIGSLLADRSMLRTYGRNVASLSREIPTWDTIAGQTVKLYETLVRARTKQAA